MAKNIDNNIGKGKPFLNNLTPPAVDNVGRKVDVLRDDVGKIRADAGALAGSVSDAAAGTLKKGTNYVQDRIDDVKDAGRQVADKVTSLPDMPIRKAVYAILALCAISFIFGRRSS